MLSRRKSVYVKIYIYVKYRYRKVESKRMENYKTMQT